MHHEVAARTRVQEHDAARGFRVPAAIGSGCLYQISLHHDSLYSAEEMFTDGSFIQRLYIYIGKTFYVFFPTYIWVLKKPNN